MMFVWLSLVACSVYLFALLLGWIWIARRHAPIDVLQRAIKIPSQTGMTAFNLLVIFRVAIASAMRDDLEDLVKRDADALWRAMESIDYSALNVLKVFGNHSVKRVIICLAENEVESKGLNQDAFTVLLDVLKHKDIGLSQPMSNALYDCVEEIRNRAFASNPDLADPKHRLNVLCGSPVLVTLIRNHLEKMISETL